jgi:signal transduction histidine kinase
MCLKNLLYIILILTSFKSFAQNARIDSLNAKAEVSNGENNFGELLECYSALRDEYSLLNDTNKFVFLTLKMADASRGGGGHLEALNIIADLEKSGYYIKPHHQVGFCLVKGSVYYELSQHENAIFWAGRGLELSKIEGVKSYIPLLNNLLGASYFTVNPDSALHYIQLSIDGYLAKKDTSGVALPYINMARIFTDKKENMEAEKMIFKSLKILDKNDVPIYRKMAYNFLAKIYVDEESYKEAVKYLKLRDSVNYAINNNEVKFQIEQFQDKLEKQKNQNDVLNLEAKIEIGEMKDKVDNTIMVLGLLLVVVLSLVLFFAIRNNGRFKILNAELKRKTERLEELDKFKNKVLSVISHDMRAPLAQIITFHQAKKSGLNFSEAEIHEMDKTILASTQSGLLILDNLLKWARSQIDGSKVKKEHIETFFTLTQILNQVSQLAIEKEIEIVTHMAKVDIETDEGLFQITVRNLLSNAIKFSPLKSKIVVSSYKEFDLLCIAISDSGSGIPESVITSLKNGEEINPRTGSFGEKGAGIGLTLSLEFAHKIGGTILFSNGENGGAIATLKVPLKTS